MARRIKPKGSRDTPPPAAIPAESQEDDARSPIDAGDDADADQARALSDLATQYLDEERYAEAEPLYRRALELARAQYGEEHSLQGSGLRLRIH